MSDLWGRWGHEARSTSWSPVAERGEMEILESSGSQQESRRMRADSRRCVRPARATCLGWKGFTGRRTRRVIPFIVSEGQAGTQRQCEPGWDLDSDLGAQLGPSRLTPAPACCVWHTHRTPRPAAPVGPGKSLPWCVL